MNGMTQLLADVTAFHRAMNSPIGDEPDIDFTRTDLRVSLLDEEVNELKMAIRNGEVVDLADALADIVYVTIGAAVEFGIPLDRVWAEVQGSNMRKVDPTTGLVRKREDGKVLKPDDWMPPDIVSALYDPNHVVWPTDGETALRSVVKLCAARFRAYEALHRAKDTPDSEGKADSNRNMAVMCEEALRG